MALFSRRNARPQAKVEAEAPSEREIEAAVNDPRGPWDFEGHHPLGDRVDLGALRIPKLAGISLRLELEQSSRVPVAATILLNDSSLQLQAFAAPRTTSLWDQIRPELAESARAAGGEVDDVPGEFGRELIAHMPVTTPGGSGKRAVRFAGIDGPRWLVRATFAGPAATDAEAARPLEDLLRDVVVVRGTNALPPREVLPLAIPGAPTEEPQQQTQEAYNAPERGPEMTETR